MQRSAVVKMIKVAHRYLGLFFAPAIIFFSFSGALQTLGLHSAAQETGYIPARWIVLIAQIHKKQTLALPAPKIKSRAIDTDDARSDPARKKISMAKRVLQVFVVLMSVALMATTLLGIIMASMYGGNRGVTTLVLIVGTLFPISVMLLSSI
jgi:hypothetical protein